MLKSADHIQSKTENILINKSKTCIIVEIIEYIPNLQISKTILKKSTGNISLMSFETKTELTEKISPYDTYLQIIEGNAELIIDKLTTALKTGEGIIIPANTANRIKPKGALKMILTIIKNEDE